MRGLFHLHLKPEGIFNQVERNSMVEKGLELATSGSRNAFEEQFLIYRV